MNRAFLAVFLSVVTGIGVLSPSAFGDLVVANHLDGMVDNLPLTHTFDGLFKDAVIAPFEGNGQKVSTFSMLFTDFDGNGNAGNGGNIPSFEFDVFFGSMASLNSGSFNSSLHQFGDPTNPDYLNIVTTMNTARGIFDIRYAEFDLGFLDLLTDPGEMYFVAVIPTGGIPLQGSLAMPFSTGGTGPGSYYYSSSIPFGPAPLGDLAPWGYATYKVTTTSIPGPGSAVVFGLGCSCMFRRRRHQA